MRARRFTRSALHAGVTLGALSLIGVIIWLDYRTTIWQEMVILAGLAAGLVSFLLTTVVIDRLVRHSTEVRWAPVTHLALTEIMHLFADDERSELSSGIVVPRELEIRRHTDPDALLAELERLRSDVLRERADIARTLGTWAQFLASSGDNERIMRDVAQRALQFDVVRDRALEVEQSLTARTDPSARLEALDRDVAACNAHLASLMQHMAQRLELHARDREVVPSAVG